jgi:hypothetical protein
LREKVALFLGPATAVAPRSRVRFLLSLVGMAPAQADPDAFALDMTGQEETNWCWSATTQAIEAHLHDRRPDQETIATEHVATSRPGATCAPPDRRRTGGGHCIAPGNCSAECNNTHDVTVVLAERGIRTSLLSKSGGVSFDAVRPEAAAGRPVICRMSFDGVGHFVCLAGAWAAPNGTPYVLVYDPWSARAGQSVSAEWVVHDEFVARYHSGTSVGRNTHAWAIRNP